MEQKLLLNDNRAPSTKNLESVPFTKEKVFGQAFAFLKESLAKNFVRNFVSLPCVEIE